MNKRNRLYKIMRKKTCDKYRKMHKSDIKRQGQDYYARKRDIIMEKCDLVRANCHANRTHAQIQAGVFRNE